MQWTLADRHLFVTLARQRIEGKKTYKAAYSEAAWVELRYQLANVDFLLDDPVETSPRTPARPLLAETRHLVGREAWVASMQQAIQEVPRKKLVIVQGAMGIGKSSELHRLIQHFIHVTEPIYHIIWIQLLAAERAANGPDGRDASAPL